MIALAASPVGLCNAAESAVETSTSLVSLPVSAPQTISVRTCGGCPAKQLRVTEDTRFFIRQQIAPLGLIREVAAKTVAGLYVFYDDQTRQVTRIKLDADIPKNLQSPEKRRGK
jgi:hypothetical protein